MKRRIDRRPVPGGRRQVRVEGFSLMAALVMTVLLGGIASALLLASSNESKFNNQTRGKMRATYLAEAGAEDATHRIRTAIAGIQPAPTSTTVTINGTVVTCAIL